MLLDNFQEIEPSLITTSFTSKIASVKMCVRKILAIIYGYFLNGVMGSTLLNESVLIVDSCRHKAKLSGMFCPSPVLKTIISYANRLK